MDRSNGLFQLRFFYKNIIYKQIFPKQNYFDYFAK